MKQILSLIIFIYVGNVSAFTFNNAVEAVEKHEAVQSLVDMSKAIIEKGGVSGSWGDPMFHIAAKNFPKETLEKDQSPMTGIEFGLSQKVSLTTKYGNIEDGFEKLGASKKYESEDKKRELVKSLWFIVINTRKLKEEIKILMENLSWISKTLKVSKKLYTNGKLSQQALFDIQIRKAEIEAELSNKEFEFKEQNSNLGYLLKFKDDIDEKSIPWKLLESVNYKSADPKELSIEKELSAKENFLTASKLNYVPDITFSVGYTKRENIDNNGDFVSASVSFPLPFSGQKYSGHSQATHEKYAAVKNLRNYKLLKNRNTDVLKHEINKINNELKILDTKTIKFAESSRKVTSKSYALGESGYVELLQSEFKLQLLLLKRSMLNAKLASSRVDLKYLLGDKLYE